MKLLENKVAIITGGTRGIGFATVEAFLKQGSKVAMCGSRQETVDKALEKLNEYGDSVMGICPKLDDAESVGAAFDEVVARFGKVDILINNAGLAASGPTYNFDDETFDRIIAINVKGVYVCSKKVINLMKENGGGCIINTSSMVSRVGTPGAIVYPGSKFAVDGMTISLAREVGKDNIRVNCVAPGITETDMMAQAPKEIIAAMSKQVPLQRLGQPEDIANAFVFLASDYASYITGAVLRVDGGMLG